MTTKKKTPRAREAAPALGAITHLSSRFSVEHKVGGRVSARHFVVVYANGNRWYWGVSQHNEFRPTNLIAQGDQPRRIDALADAVDWIDLNIASAVRAAEGARAGGLRSAAVRARRAALLRAFALDTR